MDGDISAVDTFIGFSHVLAMLALQNVLFSATTLSDLLMQHIVLKSQNSALSNCQWGKQN
jgi:hypothetical protein